MSGIVSSPKFTKETLAGCQVCYRDKVDFEAKLAAMVSGGRNKLHVISDFDFTLTKYYQEDGSSRSASCHMVLEHSVGLLPETYCSKAKGLQQKYHPIEVDPHMDPAVKFAHMEDWVNAHNTLFMESGLTQHIIVTAVRRALDSGKFRMRRGLTNLFTTLETHGVPLLIFSAGISNVLEIAIQNQMLRDSAGRNNRDRDAGAAAAARSRDDEGDVSGLPSLPKNMNVISNRCLFNSADGSLEGFTVPVLHVYNKSCHAFLETNQHFRVIEQPDTEGCKRSNVLLFGDSLGDIKMSYGIEDKTENLLKVGFLNDKTIDIGSSSSHIDTYLSLQNYDLVVFGDPGLDVQQYLIEKILSQ